ncbi:hypothetical protein FHS19_006100 [Paenibacillus rhizosphaerae]|uniref:Uncharacterized protein n=1 Tax=Paenibacillus rhizosphaerae TaxID=297318 RepID=A0A839U0V6_9BACL|nr:hypothetical protein [Paenibacillus rhizosphaerae]MBB3131380.1 hypothetical protein [Paenibacillus rhizosphaerae]
MDISSQEEHMIQALREVALPPLFVLIRIRNDILNDTVNIEEGRRNELVNTLEHYIAPLWEDYHQEKNSRAKEGPSSPE